MSLKDGSTPSSCAAPATRGSSCRLPPDCSGVEGRLRLLVHPSPDRKSTRLNSSHSQISYAVFCLKKNIYTVRNQLNHQVVTDGMVGGALSCGNLGLNRWTQWGAQSYPGASRVNIQNETFISDWNCFSKFYITFPLSSLPAGKAVAKATATLYEYANAGVQGQPNPSSIQVATVNQNWNVSTLCWNNAPQVQENITTILVNTKTTPV